MKKIIILSILGLVLSPIAHVSFAETSLLESDTAIIDQKEQNNPVEKTEEKIVLEDESQLNRVVVPTVTKPLEVTKTVNPSYTRNWEWKIEKSADKSLLNLSSDAIETVKYKIIPYPVAHDSNFMVSGEITITNPNINAAFIESVQDIMDGVEIKVECPVAIPYILAPKGTLVCAYSSSSLPIHTKNTAIVKTSGQIPGGEVSVEVIWGEPTEVVDECITLTDSHLNGPQKALYCINGQKVKLSYDLSFSKNNTDSDVRLVCGQNQFENTVDFVAKDSKSSGTAKWTVDAVVDCPTNGGGGGSGGGGGGGGISIFQTDVLGNNPPTTPDQQVLGEQVFSDGTPSQQVLGEQKFASVLGEKVTSPSFPKTGSAQTTNSIFWQLSLSFFLSAALIVSLNQKKTVIASK